MLTTNEVRVLRALRTNFYGDEGEYATWANCVNDANEPSGLTGKTLSGVIASLSKKGLVDCEGAGRDATICLTDEGRKQADAAKAA